MTLAHLNPVPPNDDPLAGAGDNGSQQPPPKPVPADGRVPLAGGGVMRRKPLKGDGGQGNDD